MVSEVCMAPSRQAINCVGKVRAFISMKSGCR